MASLGVDLFDIDNDGGFHLLNGTSDLGSAVGDTITFYFRVDYGKSAKNGNEFRLYLPLYNEVSRMEIGACGGTYFHFEPVPVEKAVAFYNVPVETVDRPSKAVRNIIQRKADFPVKVVSRKASKGQGFFVAVDGAKADTTSTLEAIYRDRVIVRSRSAEGEQVLELPADYVFVLAGGTAPFAMLEQSGVSYRSQRPQPRLK